MTTDVIIPAKMVYSTKLAALELLKKEAKIIDIAPFS
jgi:hypothetical protein